MIFFCSPCTDSYDFGTLLLTKHCYGWLWVGTEVSDRMSNYTLLYMLAVYYAALLPRRGPHIASHSVCLSVCPVIVVCLSVSPITGCTLFTVAPSYERTSKIEKTSVFAYGPASLMYFLTRAEGRISYGYLGRTNSCFFLILRMLFSSYKHVKHASVK